MSQIKELDKAMLGPNNSCKITSILLERLKQEFEEIDATNSGINR